MTDSHPRSSEALKREVSADGGSLFATMRGLWPYIWPADRRDLKLRVVLRDGAAAGRQARHHRGAVHLQMGDRCAGRGGERAGRAVLVAGLGVRRADR